MRYEIKKKNPNPIAMPKHIIIWSKHRSSARNFFCFIKTFQGCVSVVTGEWLETLPFQNAKSDGEGCLKEISNSSSRSF